MLANPSPHCVLTLELPRGFTFFTQCNLALFIHHRYIWSINLEMVSEAGSSFSESHRLRLPLSDEVVSALWSSDAVDRTSLVGGCDPGIAGVRCPLGT